MDTLITAKAGRCTRDPENPNRYVPSNIPGEIRLELSRDEELLHFKWLPRRGHTVDGEEFDLIVFPGDASFVPYNAGPNDGRICVLKFQSSDQRHLFWWQTKNDESISASEHTRKDRSVARKIDQLIQSGGDLDALAGELMDIDDEAAPGAGESSRRGGADGGRASEPQPASATTEEQPFDVASLIRGISIPGGASSSSNPQGFLTLPSLLQPNVATAILESKAIRQKLLANLPPALTADVKTEYQEKELLRKVLHSPQFSQATATLTVALREGG
ncbi:uncharacterized protein DFL_005199 [Arthrobotrys flagrans]|uniref:Pru domain-containing protein n=1 Tax=Arthrobotrys flagrans TaxID=97331 RepID=A0A437A6Z5_ARTFL|nr:hypothetical protein DFL_005199 [Arthrobotrys flagrans]